MPGCLSKIPDYIHFLLTKIHNFMQKAAKLLHLLTPEPHVTSKIYCHGRKFHCQFCTVDIDVVVLVIIAVECIGINELWIGFGVSYSFCLFATHEIAGALGPQ